MAEKYEIKQIARARLSKEKRNHIFVYNHNSPKM